MEYEGVETWIKQGKGIEEIAILGKRKYRIEQWDEALKTYYELVCRRKKPKTQEEINEILKDSETYIMLKYVWEDLCTGLDNTQYMEREIDTQVIHQLGNIYMRNMTDLQQGRYNPKSLVEKIRETKWW